MVDKKLDLMHHGDVNNTFDTVTDMKSNSDYFHFVCTKCDSIASIYGFLFDSAKRVIFNLKCKNCGAQNVRKITLDAAVTRLDTKIKTEILISRKHKDCLTSKKIVN